MKIIFRILIILAIAALIAGAYNLAFGGGTSSAQFSQRFEGGDHRSGSLGGGLMGVFSNLIEIAAIVGLVIFSQNGIKYLMGVRAETGKSS